MPARTKFEPVTMPKKSIAISRRATRSDTIRYVKQECVEEPVSENRTPATNTRSAFILKVKQENGENSTSGRTVSPVRDLQSPLTSNKTNKSKLSINKILRSFYYQGSIKLEKQDVDCNKSAGRECMNLESDTLSGINPTSRTFRTISRQRRNSNDGGIVDEKPYQQQWLGKCSNDSRQANANARSVTRLSAAIQQIPIRRRRESKKVVLLSDGQPYEPPVTRSRSLFDIKREFLDDEGYNLRKFPWRKKRCRAAETAKQPRTRRVPRNIKVKIDNDSLNSIQPAPALALANLIRNVKKELGEDNNEPTNNSRQNFNHSCAQARSTPQCDSSTKNYVLEVGEKSNRSAVKYEISKKFVKKESLLPEENNELPNQKKRCITRSCSAENKRDNGDRRFLQFRNVELQVEAPQPKVQTRHHIKTECSEELGGALNEDTIDNSNPSRNKAGRNRIKMEELEHNDVDITENLPITAPYHTRSAVKKEVHRPRYADAPSESSRFKAPARLVKQERKDSNDKGPLFPNPYSSGSSSSPSSNFSPRRSSRNVIGPSKSSRYKVPRLEKQEMRDSDDESSSVIEPHFTQSSSSPSSSFSPRRSSRHVNGPSKSSEYKVPMLVKQEMRESDDKALLFPNQYSTGSSSSCSSSFCPRRSSRNVIGPSKSSGNVVPRLEKQEMRDSDDESSSVLKPNCTQSSSNRSSSFNPRRSSRRVCQSFWRNLPVKAKVVPTVSSPGTCFEEQPLKVRHTSLAPPSECDGVGSGPQTPPTMPPTREWAERKAAKLSARKRASLTRPAKKYAEKMRESPIEPKHPIAGPSWKEGDRSPGEQVTSHAVDVLFSPVEVMEISCEELYTLNQENHIRDDFCRYPVGAHSNTNPTTSPPESISVIRTDDVDNSLSMKRIVTEDLRQGSTQGSDRVLRANKARKVLPDAERKAQPKRKQTKGNENAGETSMPSHLDLQRKKCLRNKFAEWNLFECSLIELSNQAACDCIEEPDGLDKKLLDELKERRQRWNLSCRSPQEGQYDKPGCSK